ncbi:alpha/beta fold hydrolase [Arcobacter sp. KX21116]|uniref:alpha/beta fold hydrolase n=1 Tax=Arcobacter iocasae TaxID=2906515 RepID=UPI0035D4FDB4
MKKDLLINSSGILLNILEKIFDANIEVKGIENIPKDNPKIFVANHFTRMEALLVPYALYELTNKKVGVIADDSLFNTYFGSFLKDIGAMPKSSPFRNNTIIGDLITGCKDWMIFPEGLMVKAKDISKQKNHFCVKVDGTCQVVHTGSAFFALNSQLLRDDYFNKKIKDFKKFQHKYFIHECKDIRKEETMIVPINISYSNLRTGKNFLIDMVSKFVGNIGEHFLEELEIESNIVLNSKITIQILKPISTQDILEDIYKKEKNHNNIINKYRYELTHRFMDNIYKNLNINFDHIFVLLIFLYPKKSINKNHLKRMIYLLWKELKENLFSYNIEQESNIINLISYEEFLPFENILKIAIKDNIILEDKINYFLNKNALLNSYTHHTIRLKNILHVILNEVLIIDKLNILAKNLVLKEKEEIDRLLLDTLEKEEHDEFESDYEKFKDYTNIKDKEIGRPRYYNHSISDVCVITLHGFSSSPKEVEQLSKFVRSKEINVYSPRLKGHGTVPEDLKDTTWNDWYLSLSRAIILATLRHKRVLVIGFSTGGLLALLSTKKSYIEFAGIICINTALHLNDIRVKTLLPAVSFWNELVNSVHANSYAKEYVDNHAENPDINYDKFYIKAIEQLSDLMVKTRENLTNIQSPILIIQGKDDPVVNPASAYEIFEKIKSKEKDLLILERKNHVIIKGDDTKELYDEIFKFIEKIEGK